MFDNKESLAIAKTLTKARAPVALTRISNNQYILSDYAKKTGSRDLTLLPVFTPRIVFQDSFT